MLAAGTIDVIHALGDKWMAHIENDPASAEANLYTKDHKLLWRSKDTKDDYIGSGYWDKLRVATGTPVCKISARERHQYKYFRYAGEQKCHIEFPELVSIDVSVPKPPTKAELDQQIKEEMKRNALTEAEKQKQQ